MKKNKTAYQRPALRVMNIQAISLLDGFTVNPNDPPTVDDEELDGNTWLFDKDAKASRTHNVWE